MVVTWGKTYFYSNKQYSITDSSCHMWQQQVTCNKSHIVGSRFLHAIGVKEEINDLGLEH